MRKTRRRTRIASINVIPYLDVMLVLLVIFMATAPLFNLGEVKPAEVTEEAASPAAGGGLVVNYPLDGAFAIVNPTTGEETSLFDEEEVMTRLKTECLLNKERPMLLRPDDEQSYGKVMGLYSRIIDEAECENVGLGVNIVKGK